MGVNNMISLSMFDSRLNRINGGMNHFYKGKVNDQVFEISILDKTVDTYSPDFFTAFIEGFVNNMDKPSRGVEVAFRVQNWEDWFLVIQLVELKFGPISNLSSDNCTIIEVADLSTAEKLVQAFVEMVAVTKQSWEG